MSSQKIAISVEAVEEARREAMISGLAALEGVEVLPRDEGGRPELTLLALGADVHADMALADRLAGPGAVAPVVLAGPTPAPELLLAAMRAGITEYLPEPVVEADLLSVLERLLGRRCPVSPPVAQAQAKEQGGRIILVLGAKGGIGTTTVAVNLADAMCRLGTGRTALLDLAQPQGETPIFLDLEHTYTWADVARNIERLDATYLESVMARHHSGLAVLPAPGFSPEDALDPAVLRRILELLRRGYAQVVIDAGTGHDEAALEALDMADEVLLVLDLSLPCLARAKRFMEAVRVSSPRLLPRLRLVANRKTSESDIGTNEAEGILQQEIAWAVVNDYQSALSAINQGKTLAEADPRTAIAKGMSAMARDLCRDIAPQVSQAKASGSLWARLRNTPLGHSLTQRNA
ncbi:MAG: AAA family ATPase [Proteobacteria bacterium]|nr:AAA family ATPase [Pseudomonadota bacterium]MBU1594127.1 AAA family ATPase [Pseudomonadota bacterium]